MAGGADAEAGRVEPCRSGNFDMLNRPHPVHRQVGE